MRAMRRKFRAVRSPGTRRSTSIATHRPPRPSRQGLCRQTTTGASLQMEHATARWQGARSRAPLASDNKRRSSAGVSRPSHLGRIAGRKTGLGWDSRARHGSLLLLAFRRGEPSPAAWPEPKPTGIGSASLCQAITTPSTPPRTFTPIACPLRSALPPSGEATRGTISLEKYATYYETRIKSYLR